MDQTAIQNAFALMGAAVTSRQGPAIVLLDSWVLTAAMVVQPGVMERTVASCVPVGRRDNAIRSLGDATVPQGI